jgi:hypothetical protein
MNVNHLDVVQEEYDRAPAEKTIEGALAFLLRVVATLHQRFPDEHAGLLIKTAGENIVPYGDTRVSAGRICYPDQQLVKILTDIPATNGPQWLDDGLAHVGGYIGGYLTVDAPAVPVDPPPPPDPVVVVPPAVVLPPEDLAVVVDRLAALEAAIRALVAKVPPSYHGVITVLGRQSIILFEPIGATSMAFRASQHLTPPDPPPESQP